MTTLTKAVTLSPGQSQQVSFQVTPQVARIYNVNVDGLAGTFSARSPTPPPEEVPFSVTIIGTDSPAPAGETITTYIRVTNLGDRKSNYKLMEYMDGVPFSKIPFTMDPIPAGQSVTNPGPWCKGGISIRSPVPGTKVLRVCVFSTPTGVHQDCDETVLQWT